jgi:hypothetical protein
MGNGELDSELDLPMGVRAITEVCIDRQGINYDDMLLARTCRNCGRLIFDADAIDIRDQDTYRVIVTTPDDRMYMLRGSELLTAHCACGSFCAIVVYGPALHDGYGYTAYSIVELNGLSNMLASRLKAMRRLGDEPADVDDWISGETIRGITRAIKRTAGKGFTSVSDDWNGSRYSSGWVSL